MQKATLPQSFFVKFAILTSISTGALVIDCLYYLHVQHHRPHVIDRAAGFVTRFTTRGVTYYLSQADVAILAGLLAFAVLWGAGCQFYLWKATRKAQAASSSIGGPIERRR